MTGCFQLLSERSGNILISSSMVCKVKIDDGYYYLTNDGLYYLTKTGEKIVIEEETNQLI